MGLVSILQTEQTAVVVDDERKHVMLELSSGGYRERFVTLHMGVHEIDELVGALLQAKELIRNE